MFSSIKEVILAEQRRRTTSVFRSRDPRVNSHKNTLLSEAQGAIDNLSVIDKDSLLSIINKFNDLIERDINWELERSKEPGWHFFDMLFSQQMILLRYFVDHFLQASSKKELVTAEFRISNMLRMLNTRMKDIKNTDKKFLQLQGYRETILEIRGNIQSVKISKVEDKSTPMATLVTDRHAQYEDDFLHSMDKTVTTLANKAKASPLPKPVTERSTVSCKGVLYFLDNDETSVVEHTNDIINAINNALKIFLKLDDESIDVSMENLKALRGGMKTHRVQLKQAEEMLKKSPDDSGRVIMRDAYRSAVDRDIKAEMELLNGVARKTANKKNNAFLKNLFTNPDIRRLDLKHADASDIQRTLFKINGFKQFFDRFMHMVNKELQSENRFREPLTRDQLIRPMAYAIKQGVSANLSTDDFYWYCIQHVRPMPLFSDGIGISSLYKGLGPDDKVALASLNNFFDSKFTREKLLPNIFHLTAEQSKRTQVEFYSGTLIPVGKFVHKLLHLMIACLRMKVEDGHYPEEVIMADDTREMINHTHSDDMKNVLKELFEHNGVIMTQMQEYLEKSRYPEDQKLAKHFNKAGIEEAARAAMKALNTARESNRPPILAEGAHFDQILKYQGAIARERIMKERQQEAEALLSPEQGSGKSSSQRYSH